MGHPIFPNPSSFNPCSEMGIPVLPYHYYLTHMKAEDVPQFIINEMKARPECSEQLADSLRNIPQYAKYVKTLVMA